MDLPLTVSGGLYCSVLFYQLLHSAIDKKEKEDRRRA
jgi:hypothetical protein